MRISDWSSDVCSSDLVIGAAHAGWRGAYGGVLENTVAAMAALGAVPGNIAAAIGPTIQQPSYEVDDAFHARFGPEDEGFFASGRDRKSVVEERVCKYV